MRRQTQSRWLIHSGMDSKDLAPCRRLALFTVSWVLPTLIFLSSVLGSQEAGRQPVDFARPEIFSLALAQARDLERQGRRQDARELGEALLHRAEEDFGPTSLEVARVLDLLVENDYWLGRRGDEVLARSRRALEIHRHELSDASTRAQAHRRLGAILASDLGDPRRVEEAWDHFQRARHLWRQALGRESLEVADLLTWMVELLHDWGEEGETRALEVPWIADLLDPTTTAGRELAVVAAELSHGRANAATGTPFTVGDPVLALALQAVAMAAAVEPESAAHAESLNALGNLLHRRQLYDVALVAFEQCLEVRIRVFAPGHPQIGRAYHNRGEARMLVGDLEGARADAKEAYEIRSAQESSDTRGVVATTLELLGRLAFQVGDFDDAVARYRDALPRLEGTYGATSWRHAQARIHLADVYQEVGSFREARRLYEQALEALKASVGVRGERVARVEARLGTLLARMGEKEGGERWLRQAQETQEALPDRPHADYAETLAARADIARSRGDLEASLDLVTRATSALESYEGAHPRWVDLLLLKAEAELAQGDATATRDTLSRLERDFLPPLGEAAFGALARHKLLGARSWMASGDSRAALALATEAARLYAHHLTPAFRILSGDTARRYALEHRRSLELVLALLANGEPSRSSSGGGPQAVERAWEALALHRGLVARELEERYRWSRQNAADSPAGPRDRYTELAVARRLFAEAQVRRHGIETLAERQAVLKVAARRLEVAEAAFAEAVAVARPGTATPQKSLRDLHGGLPPAAALVAFVRFDGGTAETSGHRYGAFFVQAGVFRPRFVDLGPAAGIDAALGRWRSALLQPGGDWRAAEAGLRDEGLALRRRVWDPVARLAGASRQIFLIPAGSLFLMPFAALPGEVPGTYLVEDGYEFHRLVAERDVDRRLEAPSAPRTLLAMGGPDYNAGADSRPPRALPERPWYSENEPGSALEVAQFLRDPCLDQGRLYFLRLPGAAAEAREVAAIFRRNHEALGPAPEVRTLAAAEATEEAFKTLAARHSILHVATHGFFDLECRGGDTPRLLSGLAPVPRGARGAGDPFPLISGLAFAGANLRLRSDATLSSLDDGLLTVPEIVALDLSRAEWVVLSACETALGQIAAGEGVQGLAQAFRLAGARTLILSLWPVEDQATRGWMRQLYRARFEDKASTAGSVRSASLSVLEERRRQGRTTHPYFWAAFVATGAWD